MSLQIPHPVRGLHLYRHLLREATYLPPLARAWTASRIKTRYRKNQKCDIEAAEGLKDQAHHDLRFLRSANNGHVARLLKICYMATGRLGPRRRMMIKPVLGAEQWKNKAAQNSHELAKTSWFDTAVKSKSKKKEREQDWLDEWNLEACEALAVSQYNHQGANSVLQLERLWHPEDKMKRLDALGLPLNATRERVRLKNRWAKLFPHLLVPLPAWEWYNLRDLATGNGKPEDYSLPTRRPVARSTDADGCTVESFSAGQGVSWADLVNKPMRSVQKHTARDMQSLSGRRDMDQDVRGAGRPTGMRVMTKGKLINFIYRPCWENSPLMKKEHGRFVITWGRVESSLSLPHETDLRHFKGVDEFGGSPSMPGLLEKKVKKGKKDKRETSKEPDTPVVDEAAPINTSDPFAF